MVEFSVPEVNGCCFCFSLRTGTKIIAYLQLGGLSLFLVSCAVSAYNLNEVSSELPTSSPILAITDEIIIIYVGAAWIFGIFTLITILLIVGVTKNISKYMVPWLVLAAIGTLSNVPYLFLGSLLTTVIVLINLAVSTYYWIVVYSLWKQIDNEQSPPMEQQNSNFNSVP